MSVDVRIRKTSVVPGDYTEVTITLDGATLDLGLLDARERLELIETLARAIVDLAN